MRFCKWMAVGGAVLMSTQTGAQTDSPSRVQALLDKMTLAEKIGQMNQYNGFWDATGPAPSEADSKKKYDHLRTGQVGSVLNVVGAEKVRELQKIAVEETRLGIPLIFGLDVIHGHKTLFPIPLAEAASWDLAAIEQGARIAAIESSAQGINWTFAPMVDISFDARWGRVAEGAGEDPFLGSKVAQARVRGFQGQDLTAPDTIAATAKHLAGYGFAEGGRDYNRVDMSTYTLFNVVLPPFQATVEADVKTFMNAFNTLNGVPVTASGFLLRDVLKDRWGFNGFVVSDWASIQEMVPHGYAEDNRQAAELALQAGTDMDMEGYAYVNELEQSVRSGKADQKHIDDAVRRILTVKEELGLLDDPYRYVSQEREKNLLYHQDHMAAARDMARRSIVLLKNDENLLPLNRDQKKMAVIGPLAQDRNSPLGTWRVSSDDNTAVSLLEGLEQYSQNIRYAEGTKLSIGPESFAEHIQVNETDRSGFKKAQQLARRSDVVIMMLGEHGFQSGEGRSRTRLGLPGLQQELLEAVHAVNKNIVLLVASGRPLVLTWADEHIPSIVQTWQLGTQSGNAIADVLFGEYNPAGKLPMTFPRSVGQLPMTYLQFNTGRPTSTDTVFWSHYTDESNAPLYPFGHGLSYTTFQYGDLKVDASNKSAVRVAVTVKNSGKLAGEEVVQLYIRDRVAMPVRPVKELKGFDKIHLAPGDSKQVEFLLTEKELGFYDDTGKFVVQPGEFDVMVGGSSETGLSETFTF